MALWFEDVDEAGAGCMNERYQVFCLQIQKDKRKNDRFKERGV